MLEDLLTEWRMAAGDDQLFSSSRVQAFLFELWGITDGLAREMIEEWLTVTLRRELFSADELEGLFASLEALVPTA